MDSGARREEGVFYNTHILEAPPAVDDISRQLRNQSLRPHCPRRSTILRSARARTASCSASVGTAHVCARHWHASAWWATRHTETYGLGTLCWRWTRDRPGSPDPTRSREWNQIRGQDRLKFACRYMSTSCTCSSSFLFQAWAFDLREHAPPFHLKRWDLCTRAWHASHICVHHASAFKWQMFRDSEASPIFHIHTIGTYVLSPETRLCVSVLRCILVFFFLYVPFQRREHRSNLHEQYR